ncbi:MAG: hypothetical protein RI885_2278 [Actinomycetota bacterium]
MSRFRRGPSTSLLERVLQRRIVEVLEAWGVKIDVTRANVSARGVGRNDAAKGFPDLVGCLPWGQYLAIEVKRTGEKLRPDQAAWILEAARRSEWALLVVADSLEELTPLQAMVAQWRNRPDESASAFMVYHRARWQPLRDQALELAAIVQAKQDEKVVRPRRPVQPKPEPRRAGMPEDLFTGGGAR